MRIDLISQYNLLSNKNYSPYSNANKTTYIQYNSLSPVYGGVQSATAIAPAVKSANNIAISAGAIVSSLVAAILLKNTKATNRTILEAGSFIQDIPYKKNILRVLGLDSEAHEALKSIVGKHELISILKNLQDKPEMFSVGGKFFSNVKNKTFGLNMHIHTVYSDGQMSIKRLLNLASKYADKYAEKNNKPFIIGITDHDTVGGTIEALKLITKNPDKYKNLKVILGTETKVLVKSKYLNKPMDIDLLSYCINPFDANIASLNKNRLNIHQSNIKTAISNANNLFQELQHKYNFKYSFDDFAKIRKSVENSPCAVNLSIKDYMQFRLIFADLVENNPKLLEHLNKNGIQLKDIDFSIPKYKIVFPEPNKPYWDNYTQETKNYIKSLVKEKNYNADMTELDTLFKDLRPDTEAAIQLIEKKCSDEQSELFPKLSETISFEEATAAFSKLDESISGIAHPCLIYGQQKDNKNVRLLLEEIYSNFKTQVNQKDMFHEGFYQSYQPEIRQDWKDFAITLGERYGFIKSGGLDSHFNNIFSRQPNMSAEDIEKLIN